VPCYAGFRWGGAVFLLVGMHSVCAYPRASVITYAYAHPVQSIQPHSPLREFHEAV
jgi:hypothetical protein